MWVNSVLFEQIWLVAPELRIHSVALTEYKAVSVEIRLTSSGIAFDTCLFLGFNAGYFS